MPNPGSDFGVVGKFPSGLVGTHRAAAGADSTVHIVELSSRRRGGGEPSPNWEHYESRSVTLLNTSPAPSVGHIINSMKKLKVRMKERTDRPHRISKRRPY